MKNDSIEKAKQSRVRTGGKVFLQATVMLLVVFAVNYLGFHYYDRWDFSRSQDFRLAMHTRQILRAMKQDAQITVYFSPTQASYETLIARDIGSLLREIEFSGKPKVGIEYIDPTRNLQRAQEMQAKHGLVADENVIIVEYDGRSKIFPVADMADFDFSPLAAGEPPRVVVFRGEQVLASALLAVIDPEPRKVYFLQGHGQPPMGPNSPISLLVDYIGRQNAEVAPLPLASFGVVPQDATAVFSIGARYDLTEEELQALREYWENDGRLFLLLDPASSTPHFHALAADAGVVVQDTRVLRTVPLQMALVGIVRDVAGFFLPNSDITKRLEGVNTYFPDPVQSLVAGKKTPEGVHLRPLIQAEEAYWGETEYETDSEKGVAYDDGIDTGYPVYLAFSSDRGGIGDDRVDIQRSKMITVGSSRFVLDEFVAGPGGGVANLDFVISGLNWLLDRNRLTGVVAKAPVEFKLTLTNTQLGQVAFYTMVVIPGTAALLGILVWWMRRK